MFWVPIFELRVCCLLALRKWKEQQSRLDGPIDSASLRLSALLSIAFCFSVLQISVMPVLRQSITFQTFS